MKKTAHIVLLIAAAWLLAGCGKDSEPASETVASPKVPITTGSEQALEAYLAGMSRFDSLHYAEAHDYFAKATEIDSSFAMAHLMRASTAESPEEFFASLENAEANLAGVSAGEQIIVKAFKAGSLNDAKKQYSLLMKLMAFYPEDERVHMRLGMYHINQQEFPAAARHFGHAIKINEAFAPAYNMQGYAYRYEEDFASAKQSFERYVKLIPNEPNPYDSFAELLLESGEFDASIDNYRKALAVDEGFVPSYGGIIIAESLRGNTESALVTAEKMLEVAKSPVERQLALLRAAGAFLFASRTDAALDICEGMADEAEQVGNMLAFAFAREYAGDIMLVSGEVENARRLYEEVLRIRRKASIPSANKAQAERNYLYRSALASLLVQDIEEAENYIEKHRESAMKGGNTFERMRVSQLDAYSAFAKGDFEKAAEHFALSNVQEPVVQYFLAQTQRNLGNLRKAREHAHRAAFRNVLSPSLPFYRKQALTIIKEIDEELAGPENQE